MRFSRALEVSCRYIWANFQTFTLFTFTGLTISAPSTYVFTFLGLISVVHTNTPFPSSFEIKWIMKYSRGQQLMEAKCNIQKLAWTKTALYLKPNCQINTGAWQHWQRWRSHVTRPHLARIFAAKRSSIMSTPNWLLDSKSRFWQHLHT